MSKKTKGYILLTAVAMLGLMLILMAKKRRSMKGRAEPPEVSAEAVEPTEPLSAAG